MCVARQHRAHVGENPLRPHGVRVARRMDLRCRCEFRAVGRDLLGKLLALACRPARARRATRLSTVSACLRSATAPISTGIVAADLGWDRCRYGSACVGGKLKVYSGSQELQSASEKRVPSAKIQSALRHLIVDELRAPEARHAEGRTDGRRAARPCPSACARPESAGGRRTRAVRRPHRRAAFRRPRRSAASWRPAASATIFGRGRPRRARACAGSACCASAVRRARHRSSFEKMSIGTSTSTGPGRPLSASVNAFSMISGNRCGRSTRQARFTNGR